MTTHFHRAEGASFSTFDHKAGPWCSFLLLGTPGVALDEADVLFPNEVHHRGRLQQDVGPVEFLVDFLADPSTSQVLPLPPCWSHAIWVPSSPR